MDRNEKKDRSTTKRKRLGQYMLEEGLIKEQDLAAALEAQKNRPEKIGHLLMEKNLISEVQLAQALARQHNLPLVRLNRIKPPSSVIDLVPDKLARAHRFIPIEKNEDGLVVATPYPAQFHEVEKDIRFVVQMPVEAVVASEGDIMGALELYYPLHEPGAEPESEEIAFEDIEILQPEELDKKDIEDIEKIAGLPPIVRFTNGLFAEGIIMRASDIHLEPRKNDAEVRFRVDGILRPMRRISRKSHLPVVSRIKIIAGLDISIRRRPQDGKAQIRYGGRVYDFRVSTLPTYYGEKVTVRILDPALSTLTPKDLGLTHNNLEKVMNAISHPDGLIMVTGPTGSGKTSTLYACLNVLNKPEVNIITVEDPVEIDMAGINQVQINKKAGADFSAILRSILRQDPDIVMVGEIRDAETAGISMQAAQTGHLVLSTLHTNDAPSALIRLMDLEVEPFIVASSLIVSIGQRLVRKVCPNCKVPATLSPETIGRLAPYFDVSKATFWKGGGCEECHQTGYKGRVGIFEILIMSPALKQALAGHFDPALIEDIARNEGYRTMFEDGLEKARQGLTTIDELFRVSLPQFESPEMAEDREAIEAWQPDETPAFMDEEEPYAPPKEKTVLIVDDNEEILAVLRRTLEKEKFIVLTANNGAAGMELADKQHPDLIITDYKMPVMDGFVFIKELKDKPSLSKIPIIMLTAKGEVESEVAVLEAGADDYIVKPVDRRRFVARVKRLLDK